MTMVPLRDPIGFTTLVRVPVLDAPRTLVEWGDSTSAVPLDESSFASRYARHEPLGAGGMGIVYRSVDKRIGREVAMKTLRSGPGADGTLGNRFLREACIQGQLEHPAIVPVYDIGRDADGALYFTMKRIRGATFEEIIARLREGEPKAVEEFTRRKLLTAFASVCQAIDFAHARGVVHRDLKPTNVMLGDFGEVYVLDWGVAKLLDADPDTEAARPSLDSAGDQGRTLDGAAVGTPGYMSPEQAVGSTIDRRADIYALGAILFELLAFEPLHPAGSMKAAIASTLRGLDARPSARAPGRDVPPELDAICVKATSIAPEDRFQRVGDLLDALEHFLDGDRDVERRLLLSREHATAAARSPAIP